MQKTLVLTVLVVCFAYFSQAQTDRPDPFAHYNPNNGLAAYNSNTIVQDRQGYIWIGTINGLQRFDGHRFLTFHRNRDVKNSLTDNYIDHLLYDSRGNLWVVLGNGQLGIFDTRRFTFTPATLRVKDERIIKLPRMLMEDSDGNLMYVIYGQELTTYDPANNEFSSANNFISVPRNWHIKSLVQNKITKKFWLATDSGMVVFNRAKDVASYSGHNSEQIPFIDKFPGAYSIFNLGVDKRSRLWFTTANPAGVPLVSCYDLKKNELILDKQDLFPKWVMKNYTVKRFLEPDSSVWIGGLNVLFRFNEKNKKFETVYEEFSKEGISFQEVNCLFEDREKNIWVSSDNNGMYILKPSTHLFESVKQINRTSGREDDGSVVTIGTTYNNNLLIGVAKDGIHKYDSALNYLPSTSDEKKLNTVWCMASLADKRHIWMGLQSGIMIYDDITGATETHNPPVIQNKQVRTIAEDKLGNIWLGLPNGGVYKWVASHATYDFNLGFEKVDQLPGAQIEKIKVDSKGFVWVCTLMNGVYKVDAATNNILEHLTSKGSEGRRLLADAVTDAFEFNDSLIIFPTGGLNFYNTKTGNIITITSTDGLPSDIVRSIQKDNQGNLWFGLFNGICRMNYFKRAFTYYDRNDGISNDEFNYSSSAQMADGRLLFGTTSNAVMFDPRELNYKSNPPDVAITEFRLMNKPLSVDSVQKLRRLELPHNQTFLSIAFSGLHYFNKKWTYYYMLKGLDKEWKRANELNQVDYNYLAPGDYLFMVKAENADGVPSKNVTQLQIKVDAPIYKTWWFYSILALLLAFILFLIDKERMRRKAAMQKMRADIADNLHEEVNTALNKINILSEMARLKSEKDPVRSFEFFDQIHTKSHDMIIAMDDMLWSIDPANDSMEKTIDRVREFIDSMRRRSSANIDLLIDKSVESLVLNMRLRHDVFILMKEGIRTVIHAGTKNCRVHIGLEKEGLLYTIDIDNDGCDLQQITNQLQHRDLEKRLNAINATLKSYMHQHTSIFELHVPLN